jgi:uncharacterized repeat protein (TIGR01451 family)
VLYRISVTNTGSQAAGAVELTAVMPPELKLVPGGI